MNYTTDFRSFNPNMSTRTPFATYCPYRRVEFKTHSSRAIALNAFASHYNLISLWTWKDSKWVLLADKDIEAHVPHCDICRRTTEEPAALGPRSHRVIVDYQRNVVLTGGYDWARTMSGKITDPLRLLYMCKDCRAQSRNHGY